MKASAQRYMYYNNVYHNFTRILRQTNRLSLRCALGPFEAVVTVAPTRRPPHWLIERFHTAIAGPVIVTARRTAAGSRGHCPSHRRPHQSVRICPVRCEVGATAARAATVALTLPRLHAAAKARPPHKQPVNSMHHCRPHQNALRSSTFLNEKSLILDTKFIIVNT